MNLYMKFWGIAAPVFAPGHGRIDFYLPERLQMAAQRLAVFCGQKQAVTVLAGESGVGKTTITRWLHDSLAIDSYEFMLTTLMREEQAAGWLAPRIADYMGVPRRPDANLNAIIQAVLGRMDDLLVEDRRLVIAIDAAHLIRGHAWQDIAGFLNMGTLAGSCFSFLLVGREDLLTHCKSQEDLRNKLSCKMEWPRFTTQETEGYVAFRCELAGIKSPFEEAAIAYLHQLTGGVASAINAMSENALIEAYERKSRLITADIVRAAGHFIAGPVTERQSPKADPETKETATTRLLDLTKNWIPPPPNVTKPMSPSSGSDATIRMSSLFKSRDKGGDN